MKSNFQKSLRTGFGVSLLLLIVSSVLSYLSIQNLIISSMWLDHTNTVILRSEEIVSALKDAETGQRGYIITRDPVYLEPYQGAYQRTANAISDLKKLTADNADQQTNCLKLQRDVDKRFNYLRASIQRIDNGLKYDSTAFNDGRMAMDEVRLNVKAIQSIENNLLQQRTDQLRRISGITPVIIVIAALLAVLITVYFFRRLSGAYTDKALLTQQLEQKETEIANRIEIINRVATQIAAGDYNVRLSEEQNDSLGNVATAINKMALNLDASFTSLQQKDWLQTGRAELAVKLAGEKTVEQLATDFVSFLARYSNCLSGVVYLGSREDQLQLKAAYGIAAADAEKSSLPQMAADCFRQQQEIFISDIDENLVSMFGGGKLKPRQLILFPVLFQQKVSGVVELSTVDRFSEQHLTFFKTVAADAGVTFNMAENRKRIMELLEETQAQSEELQVQHRELESINAELETQTEKLQTSEEELRVQQEELMETNQELEERSRMLEEKNQLVLMRNMEIQKKSEELALSTKYKSEFLANMSHELRTPLNSILLLSRLLKENADGNLSKDQTEYAAVIQSSGNGLLQLIDEILDLSKIESGKLQLEYENVAVSSITEGMNMLFAPLAKEKNIAFNIQLTDDVPEFIQTDKLRLEQVLKNLLSNALKFTNRGKVELQVSMSDSSNKLIQFMVTDTGIGIPEDKQYLIFEAFQQADGSTRRKFGGTGLGLSISRQLAHLLGGEIYLQSEPGKGSVFTFTVPVAEGLVVQEEKIEAADTAVAEADKNSSRSSSGFIPGYITDIIPDELPDDRDNIRTGDSVLLVVEDDPAFAKALIDMVRQKGYKAVHIVRGDKVAEAAKMYNVAGILLDIQLPVKDGITVMQELKNNRSTRPIPVHIMSSYQLRKESIAEGAIDFLQKPAAFEQMNAVLEKIEKAIKADTKKVLIVEDNNYHARALADFLATSGVAPEITANINDSIEALKKEEAGCVILDMGVPGQAGYNMLEAIKSHREIETIPIIIFTGKSLSRTEEQRILKYADAVIIKTAQSYQRILNEVNLFIHVMEKDKLRQASAMGLGRVDDVLKGKTVLVTDDDVRNIFALNKVLEKYQMKVLTATDGKEALQVLEANPSTNIVLIDIMMPEMDGYEAIRRIRSKREWKNLPVIAVTAKAMTGDRSKCIEAGASDYISKPVDTDQLISLMRVWLYDAG